MASKDLNQGIAVKLADGQSVNIRPLTIRQLRQFVKAVKDLNIDNTVELTDEDIDKMVEAAAIVLQKVKPELADDKDALEDALDIKSFNELLSVAMGNDPNAVKN